MNLKYADFELIFRKLRVFNYSLLLFFAFPISTIAQVHKLDISFGSAITISNHSWSVAGSIEGTNPNILSELNFYKITRFGGGIKAKWNIVPFANATFSFARYYTLNGNGTDIDYFGDNRTSETYRLAFNSSKGEMGQYNLGISSPILTKAKFGISLGISSILSIQKLYLNSSEIPDLNSSYTPQKKGYGISAMFNFSLPLTYAVSLETTSHRIHYSATGNWNLIKDFQHPVSFRQKSMGYDIATKVKVSKQLFRNMALSVEFEYLNDRIGSSIDIVYQKIGLETATMFNGYHSEIIFLGLGFGFKIN